MKNVIVIICDSLCYTSDIFEDMPKLAKYKENMINFSNYFSQGPYTEAAIIPIFTASNVIDHGGYMNNLRDRPININEIFKSLGYKTYNTFYFYPNSLSFLRGVDEYDYMDASLTYNIYIYRIKYFIDLHEKGCLLDGHILMLEQLLDDFFKMLDVFIDDYINHSHRFNILEKYTKFNNFNFNKFKEEDLLNRKKYYKDKMDYINEILINGNRFFDEKTYPVIRSNEFNGLSKELNSIIKRLRTRQLFNSVWNYKESQSLKTLKNTIKNLNNSNVALNSIRKWAYHTVSFPKEYGYTFLSAKVILDNTFDYLTNNIHNKNFIITHLMDTHAPLNFFSSELQCFSEEYNRFKVYSKCLEKKSNNFYKFSKSYLDEQISDFLNKLDKEGILENTSVIITSDHGSSFMGKINRNEIISTFYEENYRIPFFIIDKDIKENNVIEKLSISTQFIPTILDFMELDYKKLINNSIFRKENDYIIYEYYGAGCPDSLVRDKLFCIKNNKYKIICKIPKDMKENIKNYVTEIYDLEKDPSELINVKVNLINDEVIEKQLLNLEKRIQNIK